MTIFSFVGYILPELFGKTDYSSTNHFYASYKMGLQNNVLRGKNVSWKNDFATNLSKLQYDVYQRIEEHL